MVKACYLFLYDNFFLHHTSVLFLLCYKLFGMKAIFCLVYRWIEWPISSLSHDHGGSNYKAEIKGSRSIEVKWRRAGNMLFEQIVSYVLVLKKALNLVRRHKSTESVMKLLTSEGNWQETFLQVSSSNQFRIMSVY